MRFDLNRSGVKEFVQSQQMQAYLDGEADKVKKQVETEAATFQKSRYFAKSIERTPVESVSDGARVTVFSTDFAAHIIEFGGARKQAYSPFRRACASLGLTLHGEGERR